MAGLHSLDIVARRYGATPGALVGLDALADAAAHAGDHEAAERWRLEAWRWNEACALVGIREETRSVGETTTAEPEPEPATISGGSIAGTAPYRPDECPPWLDALLGEGVTGMSVPGEQPPR